jgi:hypothetical protein
VGVFFRRCYASRYRNTRDSLPGRKQRQGKSGHRLIGAKALSGAMGFVRPITGIYLSDVEHRREDFFM